MDVHGLEHARFSSYDFFERWIREHCPGKRVLDYSCGTGIHSILPAACGAEVMGIDLSVESLKIARGRVAGTRLEGKVAFVVMDCEALEIPDGSFDVIIDGGAFSCLEVDKALPEIARVLKPDGCVLGIETLGHNPLTNLKRKLNVLRGVRTAWEDQHILKVQDFEKAHRYFKGVEVRYFHLLSIFFLPLAGLLGMKGVLSLADWADAHLFRFAPLQRYAFKAVFKLSKPAQNQSSCHEPPSGEGTEFLWRCAGVNPLRSDATHSDAALDLDGRSTIFYHALVWFLEHQGALWPPGRNDRRGVETSFLAT